jgi:predicted transcriptional regulator
MIIEIKSMKYRSRFEIMSQILETANGGGGATKIKIMYKAFLSFIQLKEFLKFLTESDLLTYDPLSQTFKTTEKGLMFLRTYSQINELMNVSKSRIMSDL